VITGQITKIEKPKRPTTYKLRNLKTNLKVHRMSLLILASAALLHYVLSTKLGYWTTISALGFKTEVPLAFMQNPGAYRFLNIVLGIAVTVSPFFGGLAIYTGLVTWIIIWLISGISGRNNAYNKYRQIMTEMISTAVSDEDKNSMQKAANKSNKELAEDVKLCLKNGLQPASEI
jgi:hypothetical protein